MKTYRGYYSRTGSGGFLVTVQLDQGPESYLQPRLDLRNHSPSGFAWGYEGSGPAQLALALAADVTGDDDRAQRVYQDLKRHVVAGWDGATSWKATSDQLAAAIRALEVTRPLAGD